MVVYRAITVFSQALHGVESIIKNASAASALDGRATDAETTFYIDVKSLSGALQIIEADFNTSLGRLLPTSSTTRSILRTSQNRHCKLQHDIVYSVLGLMPAEVRSRISVPDYTKIEVLVFEEMFEAYIYGTHNLDILCAHPRPKVQGSTLCSFIPDLRRQELESAITSSWPILRWHSDYMISHPAAIFKNSLDRIISMAVSGARIGIITQKDIESQNIPDLVKSTEFVDEDYGPGYLETSWNVIGGVQGLLRETRDYTEIFGSNSMRGIVGVLSMLSSARKSAYDPESAAIPSVYSPRSSLPSPKKTTKKPSHLDQITRLEMKSVTVAETDSGDLCIVSDSAEIGDIIYQFAGCSIPAVLRRQASGEYTYVGVGYVHEKEEEEMIEFLKQVIAETGALESITLV